MCKLPEPDYYQCTLIFALYFNYNVTQIQICILTIASHIKIDKYVLELWNANVFILVMFKLHILRTVTYNVAYSAAIF